MDLSTVILLTTAILLLAALYASVGHGGGSGYLAAMALLGFAPDVMKPTALSLNVLVAGIGTVKFCRAGCFRWSLFWPFAAASIPAASIGGGISLPGSAYRILVGLILLYSAGRLFYSAKNTGHARPEAPPLGVALVAGTGIGLLSGLIGVGGGIFLSPLLLIMNWSETKAASGVAAAFVLANSISALMGHVTSVALLPSSIPLWLMAAGIGGWMGAEYGSRRFRAATVRQLLAAVIMIAGLKMVFT